ncbi:MAG: hypothetical protein OXB93_01220 [Cytophagales bacterium]|nr:hypothetical protein [Cytophagales bacterium]
MSKRMGTDYKVNSIAFGSGKEDKIKGFLYDKTIDIAVWKEKIVGGIAVKFITSNYKQNSNNYFENMIGETFNIRAYNVPYFHVIIINYPVPYLSKGGDIERYDYMSDSDFSKYRILNGMNLQQYGVPDLLFIKLLTLRRDSDKVNIKRVNIEGLDLSESNKDFYSKHSSVDIFLDRVKESISSIHG